MNAFEQLVEHLESAPISDKWQRASLAELVKAAKVEVGELARIAERALTGDMLPEEREACLRQVREALTKVMATSS